MRSSEAPVELPAGVKAVVAFGMLIIGMFAVWIAVVAPEGYVKGLAVAAAAVSTIVGLLYLDAAGSD